MALIALLLCAFFLALRSYGLPEALEKRTSSDFIGTCNEIAAAISGASQVFFPPGSEYSSDISHYGASSTQASACTVEPGSAEDVSKILRILGSCRTPFAVKGGGHSTNPGFSSTKGVHIAMTRFDEIKVNSDSGTVELGAGLTWDEVYATLDSTGVNVLGGRCPGIGVAGLTLGGGFSYKSSQFGLTVDSVAGYELVLPNGTFISVTSNDKDLWFGLRGGMNNFGIVTKFILKSYPQTEVWGGFLVYAEDQIDVIKKALLNFIQKDDTKATVTMSMGYAAGQFYIVNFVFYDAPTPSAGVLDEFLAIPTTQQNVSTRSFSSLLQNVEPIFDSHGLRVFYESLPVTQYTAAVFDAFVNQTKLWGPRLAALDKSAALNSVLEPFDKNIFSHGSGSAYPADRSLAVFPSAITIEWSDASLDDTMASAIRQITEAIRAVELADGLNVSHAAKYVNYALYGTPLEDMYGENVKKLHKIKAKIDPENVMGLAGGWKF